jgi:hypothetical protein
MKAIEFGSLVVKDMKANKRGRNRSFLSTAQWRLDFGPSPHPPSLLVAVGGIEVDTTPLNLKRTRRVDVRETDDEPVFVFVANGMSTYARVEPISRCLPLRKWTSSHLAFRNGNLVWPASINLAGGQLALSYAHFASLASPLVMPAAEGNWSGSADYAKLACGCPPLTSTRHKMWMLWPPYRRRVLAEADEYLEAFGDRAYSQCRTDCIEAMEKYDNKRRGFLSDVRHVLARKLGRDRYLDTATRYLEQEPYDHGPGIVMRRPRDTTLH